MGEPREIVFFFDVDNTLFDNDALKTDLANEVKAGFGTLGCERFWAIYEEQRKKHGYADYLGTLERFRLEHIENPDALHLASWLMSYPFPQRLFPDALAVVRHVSDWGLPVILTDGDGVFQPYKLQRSGLWQAFDGHVLDYVHKQEELAAVARNYPASHYVVIDDKLGILDAVKKAWGSRVTTIFVRQGHYAHEAMSAGDYAPADITLDRIAGLMLQEFSQLVPA